jgi:hypothetical protein
VVTAERQYRYDRREMFRSIGSPRRLARVAVLTIAVCGVALLARAPIQDRHTGPWRPLLRAASPLIAALPSGLTPPSVPAAWQVVSMIADDIDADGDLDVVTNDGSLELVVWINDGTGRLSRRDDPKTAAGPQQMSGAGLSEHPTESRVVAHVPGSGLPGASADASLPFSEPRSRWTGSADASLDDLVSSRSPRGPPATCLAL